MNLPFIQQWITQWKITAWQWRLIQLSIYAWIGYLLWVAVWQDPFSLQALISVTVWPILAYIQKEMKDLENNE